MDLTLKVWKQKNSDAKGSFENFQVKNIWWQQFVYGSLYEIFIDGIISAYQEVQVK